MKLCNAAHQLNKNDVFWNCFAIILIKIYKIRKMTLLISQEAPESYLRHWNLNVESEQTVIIHRAEVCTEFQLYGVPRLQ